MTGTPNTTETDDTPSAAVAPSDDVPVKRGPGRPKGLGKVPGSGRRKGTPNWNSADVREALLPPTIQFYLDVLTDQPITSGPEGSGSVGKVCKRTAPLSLKAKCARDVLDRTWPRLQATSTELTISDTRAGQQDTRAEARAIVALLSEASLADAISDPRRSCMTDAAALNGDGPDRVAPSSGPSPNDPPPHGTAGDGDGDLHKNFPPETFPPEFSAPPSIETFANGAQIIWDAERGKWCIFAAGGALHAYRRERDAARAFAETLPGAKQQ